MRKWLKIAVQLDLEEQILNPFFTIVYLSLPNMPRTFILSREVLAGSSRDILRQQFDWIISGFAFCILYEIQFNNTIFLIFCKASENPRSLELDL